MKIVIGCDEVAIDLKESIYTHLKNKGIEVFDIGVYDKTPTLYPDIAVKAAQAIMQDGFERGILLCGTGIGMAISANKVPGIRAAVCHDSYSAERARRSNNAQIMCMGARIIGLELAKNLVDIWLNCEFDGGKSEKKVNRIGEYEKIFCECQRRGS